MTDKRNIDVSPRELAFRAGHWLIPLRDGDSKIPAIKEWTSQRFNDLEGVIESKNIGLVTGYDNLWALDVDSKYATNRKEYNDFVFQFIDNHFAPYEYVWQETASKGLHFIFKLKEFGNPKDWNNKVFTKNAEGKPLLESRGIKGYIKVYNEMVLKSLVTVMSVDEARVQKLVDWARSLNPEATVEKVNYTSNSPTDFNPFQNFNERNKDYCLRHLESLGYTRVGENSIGIQIKRPGDTHSESSGIIFHDTGKLQMFSTSTPFDTERSYSPFDMFMFANNVTQSEAVDLAIEQGLIEDPKLERLFDGVSTSAKEETPRKKEKKKPTRVLRAFSPLEFMEVEMNKPPLELIGDCIPMSGLTVLYGLTKTGKSILAYQMMNDLARGNDLFGGFLRNEFGPKKVVYYDNENPRGVISKRYTIDGDLSTFYFKDVESNVSLVLDCIEDLKEPPEKFPTSEELLDQAIEIVTEKINEGFEVIIVDNMMRLVTGNNKESDVMSKIMYKFKSLSETYRVAVILVTHTNKEYKTTRLTPYHISGSAMTANLASTFIALNRNESETKYWLTIPAGRFGTPLGDGQCIPYQMEADSNFIGLKFKELDFESNMIEEDASEFEHVQMSTSIKDFDMKKRCWQIFYQEQNMNASQTAKQLHEEFPNRRKKPINHKTVNAWAHDMNAWMKERDGIPNLDKVPNTQESNNSQNSQDSQMELLGDPNSIF